MEKSNDIRIVDNYIVIGDNKIRVTNFSNIEDINWSDVQADYIVGNQLEET